MSHGISRKDFIKKTLKYTGGSLLLAGGGGTAYSYFANSEYKQDFPDVPENRVKLPKNGKSVLMLGGGLAGLQAACELADKGFAVTILEKTAIPGGKLKTWKDKHFARKHFPEGYAREHGLHAVWGFYKNLREFMGRHGIKLTGMNEGESFYYFISAWRDQAVRNKIHMSKWPVPFGRFQMMDPKRILWIPSKEDINKPAPGGMAAMRVLRKMWGFNYLDDDQRLYLDSLTFHDWAGQLGVNEQLIKNYYEALSEMTYFMPTSECSALAIANQMRLGVLPGDSKVDLFQWPPDESFINPMIRHIESMGGRIVYNAEVTGLDIKNGVVTGVRTNEGLSMKARIRRCRICGNLITDKNEYDACPFCGAHRDRIDVLGAIDKTPTRYEADYYVVSMDLPGAKNLILLNNLKTDPYFFKTLLLSQAVILCVNLLYENSDAWNKQFPPDSPWSCFDFMPTGYNLLGFTSNWSSKQIPRLGKKKIDLIEVQVSNWRALRKKSYKEVARLVHEDLKRVVPGLRDPSEFYVNVWDNYTGFRPGDESNRPSIQSPVSNLMFIGDWVFVPQQSMFMERTNVMAKTVTNMILDKAGIKEGHLKILQSGTPDWSVELLGVLSSVRP